MQAELDRALALAYRFIGRRERTLAEVRAHLRGRLDDEDTVEATISELRELGLLDDARYARMFCEDKTRLEGWGSERIRRELSTRGVERALIEHVLSDLPCEDERERALEILRHRFAAGCGDRRERERALGVLLRKGYPTELALETVSRWAGSGNGAA